VTQLLASRRGDHALAWAADHVGGTVVADELVGRWRPMWSLDVQRPDGEVLPLLLRGFREPVMGPDEPDQRRRLRREAGFLASLQGTGVHVARYHGYEPEGDWLLMERIAGTPDLTKLDDPARQSDLFRQYLADVARLNQLDWRELDLPDDFQIARDHDDAITRMLLDFRAMGYDPWPAKLPEPLVAFCDWWLPHHPPAPVDRYSVCSGDVGPDQFMFEGDRYLAMFDLEMAYVGDPLQDMGLMRLRNMCYPIPDLPGHIRHWAELMDRPLDRQSMSYWTVAGMLASPLAAYPVWATPFPTMIEGATSMHAFVPIHWRGTAEALAEFYDIELTPPERPEPVSDSFTKYHDWLEGELREYHLPRAGEDAQFPVACSLALAETARLCATIGPELVRQNLADLTTVLGAQPHDERSGLAELEARVRDDPEADIEGVLRTTYAIAARHEFVLTPIQSLCGFASGVPMERFDWSGSDR
jgi:aminoglycoside phosphotransferase (APT) family kinase protein